MKQTTKFVVSFLLGMALMFGMAQMAQAERHPEIYRAISHLQEARRNLQLGSHDFGGHRAAALNLVDQALGQCQQALQADH